MIVLSLLHYCPHLVVGEVVVWVPHAAIEAVLHGKISHDLDGFPFWNRGGKGLEGNRVRRREFR